MRDLRLDEAAAVLGVSPDTVRAWEQRFGYPRPVRYEGGEPLYQDEMMVELRDALDRELSICSAVIKAQGARVSRTSG